MSQEPTFPGMRGRPQRVGTEGEGSVSGGVRISRIEADAQQGALGPQRTRGAGQEPGTFCIPSKFPELGSGLGRPGTPLSGGSRVPPE